MINPDGPDTLSADQGLKEFYSQGKLGFEISSEGKNRIPFFKADPEFIPQFFQPLIQRGQTSGFSASHSGQPPDPRIRMDSTC